MCRASRISHDRTTPCSSAAWSRASSWLRVICTLTACSRRSGSETASFCIWGRPMCRASRISHDRVILCLPAAWSRASSWLRVIRTLTVRCRPSGSETGSFCIGELICTARLTLISDSGGLHFDLHTQVVLTPDEALGDAVLVAVRQVSAAEVVVVLLVAKHVVGDGQQGGSDCHDRLLRTAPALQAPKLGLMAAALPRRRPRGLDQQYLQPGRRVTDPDRTALPGALVAQRAQTRPRDQMARAGEPDMSTPISATITRATLSLIPGIVVSRSAASQTGPGSTKRLARCVLSKDGPMCWTSLVGRRAARQRESGEPGQQAVGYWTWAAAPQRRHWNRWPQVPAWG